MIKNLTVSFVLALGVASFACKGGGADLQAKAKHEACKTSCEEARVQCEQKCSEEADADACKVACNVAKDQCVKECKQ